MESSFGHKWRSLFKTDDDVMLGKQVWAARLGAFTKVQLRRGMNQASALNDWTPSLGEFMRLACGLPSFEQCYARIIEKSASDKVSYTIYGRIGSWDLGRMSEYSLRIRIKGMYEEVYPRILAETIGCDDEFKPVAAIPQDMPERKPQCSPETAEKYLSAMKATLK